MKLEDFKAGGWKQQYQYKSFMPECINREWTWDDPGTNMLLAEANRALGELNAFSLIVPDIDLFIQMHVAKEAQTSSRIEGTQTELDEVLMPENQIAAEKRDDWREIQNYIQAMNASDYAQNINLSRGPVFGGYFNLRLSMSRYRKLIVFNENQGEIGLKSAFPQ